MTTATGEFAINFAALGDSNPYTNANLTYISTGRAQVASGVLRYASGNAEVAPRYNGSMGSGEIRSKVELGTVGSGGDEAGAAILNSSGDGYAVKITGATSAVCVRLAALAIADFPSSGTVSAATGDVWELRRNGNNFTVYQNNTIVSALSFTDSTVTTGLSFAPLIIANNTGAATLVSFAGDGIAAVAASSNRMLLLGVG
jgi:hypothetical protein